jgi:hypothetical protein
MLLLTVHLLLAQAPAASPPPAMPSSTSADTWYGWQTLIADGASLALLGTGIGVQESSSPEVRKLADPLLAAGGGLYLLGAPIVHLRHGHPLIALLDFGLRVATPIAASLVGLAIDAASGSNYVISPGMVFGFLIVGPAVAAVIDAAFLS